MEERDTFRIVSENPIYSKYDGICNVCKLEYYPGELISPFFEGDKNYWRHTACLQLFFIPFKFPGFCNDCDVSLGMHSKGYWSKHNGIWCTPCGEKLFPKVSIAYSKPLEGYVTEIREAS